MGQRQVLVVEDEANIADSILYVMEQDGIQPFWAKDGGEALALVQSEDIDLIILDIGLPDMNGFDVCRTVRQKSKVPVIFLTARDAEIDKIVGLELGADDYVTKPFSPRELLARVNAVLRRYRINDESNSNATLCSREGRIYYHNQALSLTTFETGILTLMMAHPDRIFSRQQIMDKVWREPEGSFDRVIDTHIKTLRQKLKKTTGNADWIVTHRGLGYSYCHQQG